MSLKSIIETTLFAYGEPMGAEKLAKFLKRKKEEVVEALEELKNDYAGRGLVMVEKDGEYMLGSNPENAKYVENLVKSEFTEELSKAAVETLAIIAYKGPLTRADIEYVRGVNSSFTLRNLLMRGLIERIENPKDARSYLYRISFDFLKHFGLAKADDLPGFKDFKASKIELPEVPRPDGRDGGPEGLAKKTPGENS